MNLQDASAWPIGHASFAARGNKAGVALLPLRLEKILYDLASIEFCTTMFLVYHVDIVYIILNLNI
jgi:hypothetical protein